MGMKRAERGLGRVRISFHLLDDADHRPWVRQFFSLGFVVLRAQESYSGNYTEYMIDYDKLPRISIGQMIPLYEVVVHTEQGKVAQFEFILCDEREEPLYGGEYVRFVVDAPLRTSDLLDELQPSRTSPGAVAQDSVGENNPSDAGLGDASTPAGDGHGAGPLNPEQE